GENLHFVGKVLNIREVTEGELKALHHRGCGGGCGGCKGGCDDCGSDCGGHDHEGCDCGHCN
ncbi:MAG: peptidylprolyl isomerase, partial [Alistipes sp.]|nr:peptidylprolyl isomerase [Alistipes sp.]